jgi:DNA primase
MIPESFIQEILNRTDVVDIVDQRVKLKKSGANYSACCPFHQEKSPSFTVSPSKQFYHCFGCGAHGSAISFLMEYEGLTFVEAIQTIATQLGLTVPNEKSSSPEKKQQFQQLESSLLKANQYYKKNLRSSKEAINYLKKRGLSGEIAREFQIGFSPNSWQGLQQLFKDYEDLTLQEAGLTQKNEKGKIYDRFRNRIMFPIFNAKDNIIGFGGRVIDEAEKPKYYNSPETPLFKKSYELYGLPQSRKAIRDEQNILIVEGYMDVISLHQNSIQNVVATLGTATTIFHLKKLIRYSKKITFCFDGDQAGYEAAWKALNTVLEILEDDHEFYFLFFEQGDDPDTFIRKHSIDEFKTKIKGAMPLTEFIFQRFFKQNEMVTQEDKIKFMNYFEPIYKKIKSQKYRIFLVKKVSDLVQMSQIEIEKMIGGSHGNHLVENKIQNKIKYSGSAKNSFTAKRKYILILLMNPEWIENNLKYFNGNTIDDEIFKVIISLVKKDTGSFKNSASILRALSRFVDEKLILELESQIINFVDNIDISAEFKKVSAVLENICEKQNQSQQFAALKNKKLSDLTSEEKDFLKNYKKP